MRCVSGTVSTDSDKGLCVLVTDARRSNTVPTKAITGSRGEVVRVERTRLRGTPSGTWGSAPRAR